MDIRFSPELARVAEYARGEAMRTGHYGISVSHLMLGILRDAGSEACSAIRAAGLDPAEFKSHIDSRIFRERPVPWSDLDRVGIGASAQSALNMAVYEALKEGASEVTPLHLLAAICHTEGNPCAEFLASKGVGAAELRGRAPSPAPAKEPQGTKRNLPSASDIADAIEAEIRRTMHFPTIGTKRPN